jgi:hypothetical protein
VPSAPARQRKPPGRRPASICPGDALRCRLNGFFCVVNSFRGLVQHGWRITFGGHSGLPRLAKGDGLIADSRAIRTQPTPILPIALFSEVNRPEHSPHKDGSRLRNRRQKLAIPESITRRMTTIRVICSQIKPPISLKTNSIRGPHGGGMLSPTISMPP